MEIKKTCDPLSFAPIWHVAEKEEVVLSFKPELFQDVKFGPSLTGSLALTDEQTWKELRLLYKSQPHHEKIDEAFDLIIKHWNKL